jgi:myo-inositol-1(or 4)-monophosphatase
MTDLIGLLKVAHRAVDLGRDILTARQATILTAKGDRDLVTEVDLEIERTVRDFLQRETPEVGFLGEEEGQTGHSSGLVWALDPIDGTVNYVHGLPLCGVSLGLLDGTAGVLGVIDTPMLHRRYHAIDGGGAYAGDMPLRVSTTETLADAMVAIGDYAVGDHAEERNRLRLAVTTALARTAQRVRMYGAASIDLVWLAEGRIDAMITLSNKPWDMAAGVVIAREAGARVVDLDGTLHTSSSSATIAANPTLLPHILTLTNTAIANS